MSSPEKHIAKNIVPAVAPTKPRETSAHFLCAEQLLGERGEVKIQHNGELYSLRRTRQGKLILTN